MLYRSLLAATTCAMLASAFPVETETVDSIDTNTITLSFDGCVNSKQAAIVLPSTNPVTLKAGLESVGKQFPVTIFATDAHFRDPHTLHLLQQAAGQKLHTIAYQFNPELSRNAGKAQPAQIESALKSAKQLFKTHLNQALVYALVPSTATPQFADIVARQSVYPVVPNADTDSLPKTGLTATTVKGMLLSINPSAIESTPDFANQLVQGGYEITPLSHCLPVVVKSAAAEDVTAKKGNATEKPAEAVPEESTVASQSAGMPWGMIAIGAFVIGGVVLAVYFYRTQA